MSEQFYTAICEQCGILFRKNPGRCPDCGSDEILVLSACDGELLVLADNPEIKIDQTWWNEEQKRFHRLYRLFEDDLERIKKLEQRKYTDTEKQDEAEEEVTSLVKRWSTNFPFVDVIGSFACIRLRQSIDLVTSQLRGPKGSEVLSDIRTYVHSLPQGDIIPDSVIDLLEAERKVRIAAEDAEEAARLEEERLKTSKKVQKAVDEAQERWMLRENEPFSVLPEEWRGEVATAWGKWNNHVEGQRDQQRLANSLRQSMDQLRERIRTAVDFNPCDNLRKRVNGLPSGNCIPQDFLDALIKERDARIAAESAKREAVVARQNADRCQSDANAAQESINKADARWAKRKDDPSEVLPEEWRKNVAEAWEEFQAAIVAKLSLKSTIEEEQDINDALLKAPDDGQLLNRAVQDKNEVTAIPSVLQAIDDANSFLKRKEKWENSKPQFSTNENDSPPTLKPFWNWHPFVFVRAWGGGWKFALNLLGLGGCFGWLYFEVLGFLMGLFLKGPLNIICFFLMVDVVTIWQIKLFMKGFSYCRGIWRAEHERRRAVWTAIVVRDFIKKLEAILDAKQKQVLEETVEFISTDLRLPTWGKDDIDGKQMTEAAKKCIAPWEELWRQAKGRERYYHAYAEWEEDGKKLREEQTRIARRIRDALRDSAIENDMVRRKSLVQETVAEAEQRVDTAFRELHNRLNECRETTEATCRMAEARQEDANRARADWENARKKTDDALARATNETAAPLETIRQTTQDAEKERKNITNSRITHIANTAILA